MSAKHTPGPWGLRINGGSAQVTARIPSPFGRPYSGPPGDVVAYVAPRTDDSGGTGARDANARLIAAAPDLLEIVRRFLDLGRRADPVTHMLDLQFAREVLAQVAGGKP